MNKKYRVVKINEKLFLFQTKTWFGWQTLDDYSYEETAKSRFYKSCKDIIFTKEQIVLEN